MTLFKNRLTIIFVALSMFSIAACKKEEQMDEDQDKIWTEYELLYDKNDDKTHAIARYRIGDKNGELIQLFGEKGAKVTFNEVHMPYSSTWSAHYLVFDGRLTTGMFAYTNTNGTLYKNAVPSHADTLSIPADFDTIVKSQNETIPWLGNALYFNESVNVFIGSWSWSTPALVSTDAFGVTQLNIGTETKSSLALGQTTIFMDRITSEQYISGTPRGGTIRSSYRTLKKTVTVVP